MKNRKYRLQKDIVFLTVSMFITVFIWISFNIYDAYVTSTIDDVLQTQILPIDGKFNVDTIEKLQTRKIVAPDYTEASPQANLDIEPTVIPDDLPGNTISPSLASSSAQEEPENADLEDQQSSL